MKTQNFAHKIQHPVFKVVSQIISEKGLEAYVIGGFVRDLLLDRPSKDIDIVVVKNNGDSGNALKERLKDVTNVIDKSILDIVPDDPNTNKKGSVRKIIYSFPKVGVNGTYGEVRENIALEVSHMGNTEPCTSSN